PGVFLPAPRLLRLEDRAFFLARRVAARLAAVGRKGLGEKTSSRLAELDGVDLANLLAAHRPEACVARPVAQIASVVGRAGEHHLPRHALRSALIWRAVIVLARADELLDP